MRQKKVFIKILYLAHLFIIFVERDNSADVPCHVRKHNHVPHNDDQNRQDKTIVKRVALQPAIVVHLRGEVKYFVIQ